MIAFHDTPQGKYPDEGTGSEQEPRSTVEYVDVFDGAEEMAGVTMDMVPVAARVLAFTQGAILVRYDRDREQFVCYYVDPRIPCGRRSLLDDT